MPSATHRQTTLTVCSEFLLKIRHNIAKPKLTEIQVKITSKDIAKNEATNTPTAKLTTTMYSHALFIRIV